MAQGPSIKHQFQLLSMSAAWEAWFDGDWAEAELPGEFQQSISPQQLCGPGEFPKMAGLIPPDCIPILGNGYGDWICARVTEDNSLGELIHWYHGGGDWIPVGANLRQACLHDFVDGFRPKSKQMLRGATEIANVQTPASAAKLLESPWLTRAASDLNNIDLQGLASKFEKNEYHAALESLRIHRIAVEAVSCDLLEYHLAAPLSSWATPDMAARCKMDWQTNFMRLLFDFRNCPTEHKSRFRDQVNCSFEDIEQLQDWNVASTLAADVLKKRQDLGWARDIVGWAEERQGNQAAATRAYESGLSASCFSDQTVRLRTHWYPPSHPNFASARLVEISPGEFRDRPLHTCQDWLDRGNAELESGNPSHAYASYFHAGWGIGFANLAECKQLLKRLIRSAEQAGWQARAATAAAHLEVASRRQR